MEYSRIYFREIQGIQEWSPTFAIGALCLCIK